MRPPGRLALVGANGDATRMSEATASRSRSDITVKPEDVFPILEANILADGFHLVVDLEKSHGSYMVDALRGKEYLDCYTYFASLPIGHNHPKMREDGFRAALMRAASSNPANSDLYTREFAAFVQTFRAVAAPRGILPPVLRRRRRAGGRECSQGGFRLETAEKPRRGDRRRRRQDPSLSRGLPWTQRVTRCR